MSDMFDDIKQKCDRFTMGCIDLNNRLGKIERDFQGEKKRLAPTANKLGHGSDMYSIHVCVQMPSKVKIRS
jgi:hypothetical protein